MGWANVGAASEPIVAARRSLLASFMCEGLWGNGHGRNLRLS